MRDTHHALRITHHALRITHYVSRMIRPFDLRDIPLLTRLESDGVSLCHELALTHGEQPLRWALAGYFSLRKRRPHTCVALGEPEGEGFVQMRPYGERGVLMYIAPSLAAGQAPMTWCALLEAIVTAAGTLGLHQLIAQVPGEGPALDVLRQAGFAVYLRQDILCRMPRTLDREAESLPLRMATPADAWAIQQLYSNTTPRLAQLADTASPGRLSGPGGGYVFTEGNEVTAYLELRRGPLGAWLNVVIHPQAETRTHPILTSGLALLGERWRRPVYCYVRRYQEWLRAPLLALGFELFQSSAVLVKRLVAPVAEPERAPAHALEVHQVTSPARAVAHPAHDATPYGTKLKASAGLLTALLSAGRLRAKRLQRARNWFC